MLKPILYKTLPALAVLGGISMFAVVSSGLSAADDTAASQNSVVVTGITKPSREAKLAFGAPGLVANVAVKEGDTITKGQILASLDTRQDEDAFKSANREAESTEKVDYSKDDLASKQVVLKRKQALFDQNRSASASEVEEADLAVKLATAQIALAQLEHDQKGFDADKEKVHIEQMKIASRFDGVVEDLNVDEGEMADPQSKDGAIVVGQWDPLWLEVHLPSSQAALLKKDEELPVRYPGEDWKEGQTAKIILLKKVDAASDTELVRMELANSGSAKHPGLHMEIRLPKEVSAVASTDAH